MMLEKFGHMPGTLGHKLLLLHCQNLGDSRVVECTHQTAKDTLRSSRHFQRSVTSRMSAVIHSPALKQRKLDAIPLPTREKLVSGIWSTKDSGSNFRNKALPENEKLDKDFQKMMLPNRGRSAWPSPTPASMYLATAATEFLFKNFGVEGTNLADGWLSILSGLPGSIIAHEPTGQIMWTVTHSEFSFLAWMLKVHTNASGSRF